MRRNKSVRKPSREIFRTCPPESPMTKCLLGDGEAAAMTQWHDSSTQSAMNLPELLNRLDNDRDLLIELITIFHKKYPVLLLQLQSHIGCKDANKVISASHALKGMLLCLSATRAAALAGRLEQMGVDGESCGLPWVLTLFENEVAILLEELDSYTTKVGS
jgi:HPt (histidine-containing phosphotransfer) domain-containing protein